MSFCFLVKLARLEKWSKTFKNDPLEEKLSQIKAEKLFSKKL
jgi:hypothetical protein